MYIGKTSVDCSSTHCSTAYLLSRQRSWKYLFAKPSRNATLLLFMYYTVRSTLVLKMILSNMPLLYAVRVSCVFSTALYCCMLPCIQQIEHSILLRKSERLHSTVHFCNLPLPEFQCTNRYIGHQCITLRQRKTQRDEIVPATSFFATTTQSTQRTQSTHHPCDNVSLLDLTATNENFA